MLCLAIAVAAGVVEKFGKLEWLRAPDFFWAGVWKDLVTKVIFYLSFPVTLTWGISTYSQFSPSEHVLMFVVQDEERPEAGSFQGVMSWLHPLTVVFPVRPSCMTLVIWRMAQCLRLGSCRRQWMWTAGIWFWHFRLWNISGAMSGALRTFQHDSNMTFVQKGRDR